MILDIDGSSGPLDCCICATNHYTSIQELAGQLHGVISPPLVGCFAQLREHNCFAGSYQEQEFVASALHTHFIWSNCSHNSHCVIDKVRLLMCICLFACFYLFICLFLFVYLLIFVFCLLVCLFVIILFP